MCRPGYIFLFLCHGLLHLSDCSHFRGAHFWWTATGVDNQVELSFRVSWRRDYRENTVCDESVIASKALIGPLDAGFIKCFQNCEDRIGDMLFQCTDFSIAENWVSGLRSHNHTFPTAGRFVVRWTGRSWLEEVLTNPNTNNWIFLTTIDTSPRGDGNPSPNSSPRAAIGTIVRVQQNCNLTVSIPVTDPDDDVVRCRWAIKQNDECGGVCGIPTGILLDMLTCRLQILNDAQEGLYAIALQLEDHTSSDTQFLSALSSVPLQFLLQVYASQGPCDVAPVFIAETPQDGECIGIMAGTTLVLILSAQTKDQFTSIVAFDTVSAVGMLKSGISRSTTNPEEYSITITWTPSNSQIRQHLFCFAATDNTGLSSEQRCLRLSVGETAPLAEEISYNADTKTVRITFDQEISSMNSSRGMINFFTPSSTKPLYSVLSNNDSVHTEGSELIIELQDDDLFADQDIYVLLSQGVVHSIEECRTGSAPVTDQSLLRINTGGQTSSSTASPPNPSTNPPEESSEDDGGFEYRWLVILVAVVLVLFVLLVVLTLLIRRKRKTAGETEEQYPGEFPYNATKIIGYDGPYAPNFHDIEVKFR